MDSKSAWKLPSPKPSSSLRWMNSKKIGPIFFEFIQRKEDEGFGEGNFQALFESMERDQMRRGALKGGGGQNADEDEEGAAA